MPDFLSHSVDFSTLGPANEDHSAYTRGALDRWQRGVLADLDYGACVEAKDTMERLNSSMSRVTRTLSVVA